LNINPSTGAVTGTPIAAGTTSFTVKATDSAPTPQTATQAISNFAVAPALLTLTCSLPANARVGVAYSGSCTAGGGTPPFTYSVAAGLPGGLNINPSTGAVTGTPIAAGTTSFTVKATDGGSPAQTATQAIANFVVAPPTLTLTCSLPAGAQVGVAYAGSCTAGGGTPPFTYSVAPGLPDGLNINPSTGAITGTPITAGTTSFTVNVTDSGTPTQSTSQATANFVVAPATLTLTCSASSQDIVGTAYPGNCNAGGGTVPYTYSFSAGSIPNGLSVNPSNGVISGTPTTAGIFTFTVKVADSGIQTATQQLTVTIIPVLKITTTTLNNGTVGIAYSANCSATGGTPPYTYSISAGGLPGGLSLNSANCAITGTPSASGTFNFDIKVTDSAQTGMQPLSITVSPALTLTIVTTSLGAATVGISYSATMTAQSGTTPYAWIISEGALPPGLALDGAAGTISGNPTTAGTYSFKVSITDSGNPKQSASQTFILPVNPASAPAVPAFNFSGVPANQTPGQTTSGPITVALSPVSSAAWPITVTLGFAANATGVPAGYADPALQFIDSSGNKLGTTYNVTVSAMSTSVPLPSIAPGTVAGNISLTLTVQAQTGAISAITVPPLAPIISPGSVQILNVTASGFDVELVANSSPRDLKTATFAFSAAAGTQITGTSTFSIDVTALMTNWYAGAAGQSYGSAFSLTVPFTFSGSSAAISSVTVTLTNSVGTSSAVAGTK
jgi:hypothetical protein